LRERIQTIPVIDCHEHTVGPKGAAEDREPIASLIPGYVQSDLTSVAYPGWDGAPPDMMAFLNDQAVATEEKWPLFSRLWRATEHTAYARVTMRILRDVYGENEMSLAALRRIGERLVILRDEVVYRNVLDRAGIRCRLVDIWPDMKAYLTGRLPFYERDRLLISLPQFHAVNTWLAVNEIAQLVGPTVTSLDGYLAACREVFRRMKERGAIGMKDQAAYERTLFYENPTRDEAERLFNLIMADPRRSLGWPQAKPLDDFLFHRFMEMARDLDLPVQIHTGHMAGIRNDIAKTNAVLFTNVLEMHREVRFDLFHGNWPYMGEFLYLGKNYPNVHLDLCWLHIIDPVYAQNLLSEGLTAVPHSKFHAFGGDYRDVILHAEAHLAIARDVIAAALAERVEWGWLSEEQALQIAADWLFNNPNEFFRLGFAPID
jgi:predicted TIM-barrel fold metal-dependent hydrolase